MYEYETSEKSHKIKHVTSNNGFKIIDGKIHILKSSIYRITASVNVYNQMMIAIQFYYNEVSNSVALDIIKGSGASSSRTVIYDELYALQENDTLDIYFNTHGGELMQNLRTIITEI